MKVARQRLELLKSAFGFSFMWVLVGAIIALAVFFLIQFIFDPNWTTQKIAWLIGTIVAAPAAMFFGYFAFQAIRLSGNQLCLVCQNERKECTCCAKCEGSGRTNMGLRLSNWFLPEECMYCGGLGNESTPPQQPEHCCAVCGGKYFGKYINLYRLHYVGGPTGSMTSKHQWTERCPASAFICYKCGQGCETERQAEDKMAHKLTNIGWGLTDIEVKTHDGGGTVYWGREAWLEVPKEPRRDW